MYYEVWTVHRDGELGVLVYTADDLDAASAWICNAYRCGSQADFRIVPAGGAG